MQIVRLNIAGWFFYKLFEYLLSCSYNQLSFSPVKNNVDDTYIDGLVQDCIGETAVLHWAVDMRQKNGPSMVPSTDLAYCQLAHCDNITMTL